MTQAHRDKWHLGGGWRPDTPDARDHTIEDENVMRLLRKSGITRHLLKKKNLPPRVDLRKWCSPVLYQGTYNTCTAHAVTSLVQFLENRMWHRSTAASRLFLYKITKNLIQEKGDQPVFIRQTFGALTLVGVPPEEYWPYLKTGKPGGPPVKDPRINAEPSAFCYAVARDYRSAEYFRLDPMSANGKNERTDVLRHAQAFIAAKLPIVFGVPIYASVVQAMKTGMIPYPADGEQLPNTHCMLAVGYDDSLEIRNGTKGPRTRGAVLVKNSWGTTWGEKGYGWLPYEYFSTGDARDLWTIIRPEWINMSPFQIN
jgi:C1A family cysteine protease